MLEPGYSRSPWSTATDLADLTGGDPVLSVAGLSGYLESLLQEDPYLVRVWVTGEVSSCSHHRNGHWFLTLTDPTTGDAIKGVVWQPQVVRLTCIPKTGLQIMALGQVGIYAKGSTYQLQIWQILPAGEGLLALRYQQLRSRLAAEGLFDADLKRPLPQHPECIAVITSPQAAAWGDIQRTWRSRYPGLHVLLSAAIVQGDQSPASIVNAFRRVEQDGRAQVVILARGGGASEDLWCFNDERVVRAVAECQIPVITGIGHQRDETLADLAADHCAHTPTAAAERAVPHLSDLEQIRQTLARDLVQTVCGVMAEQAQQLQRIRSRLKQLNLHKAIDYHLQQQRQLQDRLIQASRHHLEGQQQRQQALGQQLAALDPTAVLRRGYALVRTETGAWLRSAQVAAGTRLRIELASGHLDVRVEKS